MYNKKIDNRKGLNYWYCCKFCFLEFISEFCKALPQDLLLLLEILFGLIVGIIVVIFLPILVPIIGFNRWRATVKYYQELDKKK